jgi:hypothetical protein
MRVAKHSGVRIAVFQCAMRENITRRTDTNGNPLAVFLRDSSKPKQNIKFILLSHDTGFLSYNINVSCEHNKFRVNQPSGFKS